MLPNGTKGNIPHLLLLLPICKLTIFPSSDMFLHLACSSWGNLPSGSKFLIPSKFSLVVSAGTLLTSLWNVEQLMVAPALAGRQESAEMRYQSLCMCNCEQAVLWFHQLPQCIWHTWRHVNSLFRSAYATHGVISTRFAKEQLSS